MPNAEMNAYLSMTAKLEKSSVSDMEKELEKGVDKAADKGSSHLSAALGTAAKAAAAALTATIGAALAGLGALAKQSFEAYGSYEQLVGGVDTLFKDATDIVQANAAKAYETAGMTANEYMETATSFAASLIKGLGDDTEEAARLADMAIRDMADNANKMGTSIESIQVAYQGLAKGNATMLDNLKIGYGGTQTEMLKLARDMGVIDESIQSFSDMTFDQAVRAIHELQVQLGISGLSAEEAAEMVASGAMTEEEAFKAMGTTAKEAAGTIQGSMSAFKASWGNLLVGLADENSNLETLVNTVVDNAIVFLDKAIPRIERIVDSIGTVMPTIISKSIEILNTSILPLFTFILESLAAAMPSIAQAGVQLFTSLIAMMPTIVESIVAALPVLVDAIMQFLANPEVITNLIDTVLDGLVSILGALPEIINQIVAVLPDIIMAIVETLLDHVPDLVQAGIGLLTSIVYNLPEIIAQVLIAIPQIIMAIFDAFAGEESRKQMVEGGIQVIKGFVEGIKSTLSHIWNDVKDGFSNFLGKVKSFFGIHSPSTVFAGFGDMLMQGLAVGIEDGTKDAQEALDASMRSLAGTASLQASVTASSASVGSGGGSFGSITIGTLNLNCDSQTTLDSIVGQIRRAAAMA